MPTRRPIVLSVLLLLPAPFVAVATWFMVLFAVGMSQAWHEPQPAWLQPVSGLVLALGVTHAVACITTGVLLLNGKGRWRWLAVVLAALGAAPVLAHLVWWTSSESGAGSRSRAGITLMDVAILVLWAAIAWLARRPAASFSGTTKRRRFRSLTGASGPVAPYEGRPMRPERIPSTPQEALEILRESSADMMTWDDVFELVAAWADGEDIHMVARTGILGLLKGRTFPYDEGPPGAESWPIWLGEPDDLDSAPVHPDLGIPWVGEVEVPRFAVPENVRERCRAAAVAPWPRTLPPTTA